VPKSLSARIVVNLHPRTLLGLVGLLQRQGDVAKWTPAARIEQMCFGGFKGISPNFHRISIRVFYTSRSPAYCALAQGVLGPVFALTFWKQCYTFRNLSSGYPIRPSSPCLHCTPSSMCLARTARNIMVGLRLALTLAGRALYPLVIDAE
jgi:hypothetical protein